MRMIVWKTYEIAKARYHSFFEKLDDVDTYLRVKVDPAILAALTSIEKNPTAKLRLTSRVGNGAVIAFISPYTKV